MSTMYILPTMKTTVRKWGNSLGLRISKALAQECGIADGTEVAVEVDENGCLRVRPAAPEYRLEDLLSAVTDDNLHAEIPSGPPRGDESW